MQRLRCEFMWRCSQWRCAWLLAAAAGAWRAHVGEARRVRRSRAGDVSFGVRTRTGFEESGSSGPCPRPASCKAKLLVAYLRQPNVRHRRLRGTERALLGPMIRRSDNAAASQVCNILGYPIRPWGSTPIDVAGQTRFFLHIERRVPRRHRRYAMRLLGSIVPAAALGHRTRPPARLGALLQGRLGLARPAGATRWRCAPRPRGARRSCSVAEAASRSVLVVSGQARASAAPACVAGRSGSAALSASRERGVTERAARSTYPASAVPA